MPSTDHIPGPDVPYIPSSVPAPSRDHLEPPIAPTKVPTATEKVYGVAKANLGQKLTLNPHVSPEVRCAQALSKILVLADYPIPKGGISTVREIIAWCENNGFKETVEPVPGCIVTASGNSNYSHCGVVVKYGVVSNDSRPEHVGTWMQNYKSTAAWVLFYSNHGSKTRYFIPV